SPPAAPARDDGPGACGARGRARAHTVARDQPGRPVVRDPVRADPARAPHPQARRDGRARQPPADHGRSRGGRLARGRGQRLPARTDVLRLGAAGRSGNVPGFAAGALLLILVGAVVGGSLAVGAPVLAIPIVFVILVLWGGARLAVRRERPGIGEEDVHGERVEFDERDRRTLTPPGTTPPARER